MREIRKTPMFMQRSPKNACMGQAGLEIGCLAPHWYQADAQLLSISQMLPTEESTAFQLGRNGEVIMLLYELLREGQPTEGALQRAVDKPWLQSVSSPPPSPPSAAV